MSRQTRTKPKPKNTPYSKDPKGPKRTGRLTKAHMDIVDDVVQDSVVELPSTSSGHLSTVQGGLVDHNSGVSVISELSELKKSIQSMSNMLGSFLTTMSS